MKWCLVLLSLSVASHAFAQPRNAAPRIAVVVDGDTDVFRRETARLAHELDTLFSERFEGFSAPSAPTHVGDFTPARADALVAAALADRSIDMVVGLGLQTGRAVARIERLSKPVFLPFASPELQGLPREGETSGRRNLSYLTGLVDLERDLRRFREVVRLNRTAILIDRVITDAIPELEAFVGRTARAENAGPPMQVQIVPVDATAESVLSALEEGIEAVYIGPLIRLPESEVQPLIDGLNARRLPTYASDGRSWVNRGAFTSLVPDGEVERRMRRVALNIQETLARGEPSTYSIVFEARAELSINMATARAIGIWPRFELMTEAVLVGMNERQRGTPTTLRDAVAEAVQGNLGLGAARLDVDVADAGLAQTRGGWLPTVDAQAGFTWQDPDVSSSLGSAERQVSWGLSGQQVVYSPTLHRGIRAQEANIEAATRGVQSSELDVVRDATIAYLDVLRARTAERVNRENLTRIRRNLSLAEVRVQIGSGGREEVFRWEIEIADGRANVIAATARRNQAEIGLNRVLNRELEAPVHTVEPTEPDVGLVMDPRVLEYVEDPWSFGVLRAFVAEDALEQSPELKQIDAALRAQNLALDGRRQQLYVPDVVVTGGFTNVFHRSGAGSEALAPIPGIDLPQQDNFTWQVGAALRFRLFDASRYGAISQARAQIEQLEMQRQALAQSIEANVRAAMHQAGASRAAVRLRADAQRAAAANLELVSDAYRRGAANVVTLIDAQNQARLTALSASNAVYDFLADYIRVERAAGRFGFRLEASEREEFVQRLTQMAAARRASEIETAQ